LIDSIQWRYGGALVALRGWQLAFGILAAVIAMPTTPTPRSRLRR
jgi:hypothetical protein